MPSALVAPYTESLGHLGRSRVFADLLRDAGWRVRLAGGGRFDALLGEPVLATPGIPYPSLGRWLATWLGGLPFFSASDRGGAPAPPEPGLSLDELTASWRAVLTRDRPDVVVTDGRPEIYWAALAEGIPLYGVFSYAWTKAASRRHGGVPEEEEDAAERAPSLLARFNEVGERLGLPPVEDCWAPFCGRGALLPDARAFVGHDVPDGLTMGPLVWGAPVAAPVPEGPYLYVTTGTSAFDEFLSLARGLAEAGHTVVLDGGVRDTPLQRAEREGRLVRLHGLTPGLELVRRARLVVCHGGSQTLYACARSGVPALVRPQHFDHRRNGRLFEAHGFAYVSSGPPTVAEALARLEAARPAPLAAEPPPTLADLDRFLCR